MTQEDKELLYKDLCARLPYRVKVNEAVQGDFTLIGLLKERAFTTCETEDCYNDFPIECIKPYLFPLSSMTEEQRQESESLAEVIKIPMYGEFLSPTPKYYDWLNKNHFDYRGLIEKGLAIDATGLNIY